MKENITKTQKIISIIAVIPPLLYGAMYLPIWNGKELIYYGISFSLIFQVIFFLLALINICLIFYKKKMIAKHIFYILIFLSSSILCFYGIFFIEKLLDIPLFPPQD